MSSPDIAVGDAALVAILSGDPTLQSLLPDGVYIDVAPAGKTRVVLVSQIAHQDTEGLGLSSLYQRSVYAVKAVVLAKSPVVADQAAYRIHTLLHGAGLGTLDGYTHMSTLRVGRIRFAQPDATDADLRWQHSGAHYEIFVSPND